jgi:hypothetical protein
LLFGPNGRLLGNTDANDYKTPGIYTCPTQSVAQTISHIPYTNGGGSLIVISAYASGAYTVQVYVCHTGIYARKRITGDFGNWTTIVSIDM